MIVEVDGVQIDVPEDASPQEIDQIFQAEMNFRKSEMAPSHGPADGQALPSHGVGRTTAPHPALRAAGDVITGIDSGMRFLRPVSGAITATARGIRGDEGTWGDRFHEDMQATRDRDAEVSRRSPGLHTVGSLLPLAVGTAAGAAGLLSRVPSVSAMAPQAAEALPLLARALAGYADAGIANTASELLSNADEPTNGAANRAAESPWNALGAVAPALAEITGPWAKAAGEGQLKDAARRAWLSINPGRGEVQAAQKGLGGWETAGELLRDLRLPDGTPVVASGDTAANILPKIQMYRQLAGAQQGQIREAADAAMTRVDLDEVLGKIEAAVQSGLNTRAGRAVTPEAVSDVQQFVNRIRRQYSDDFQHTGDVIDYPERPQGELGLGRGPELVPGPEAQVDLPAPRQVTDANGNPIIYRDLAGATVPGAKANEGPVQSELALTSRRRADLEATRDRMYNPEETSLPGKIDAATQREGDLDRELYAVQRANEKGEIRDPSTRRNRLYGNAGPVKVDPVQVLRNQKLAFLREQLRSARSNKAKAEVQAEIDRVNAMKTEDELRSSYTEQDLARLSTVGGQDPTDVSWFTAPRGVNPDPSAKDYGGTQRPQPNSGFHALTEDQAPVPVSQSLARQGTLPLDGPSFPEQGPVRHVASNIRLRRPSLTEWEELKQRIQGFVNDTSAKYPRSDNAIGNNPTLAAMEEIGGIVKTADEDAIARALGEQTAADFRTAKRQSGQGQALESLAEQGALSEAPVARNSGSPEARTAGWGLRHALPLTMGAGAFGASGGSLGVSAATTGGAYVLERAVERAMRANARATRVHDALGRGLLAMPRVDVDPRALLPFILEDEEDKP